MQVREGHTGPMYDKTIDWGHPDHKWTLEQVVPPVAKMPPQRVNALDLSKIHVPHINLADLIDEGAPDPPRAVWRAHHGYSYGDLMNSRIGDCAEAMGIHGTEIMHLDVGTPPPPFADVDAGNWYSKVGGWKEGDPSTDNGTDNQTLVDDWRKDGIRCAADGSIHQIIGTAWVDLKDSVLSKRAVHEFAVLFRALAMPTTAENQNRWALTDKALKGDAEPGSWGGHDVPYFSYDEAQWLALTWGIELCVGDAFDQAYAIQGFVVITAEMLSRKGMGPSGVRWDKLGKDFKALYKVH